MWAATTVWVVAAVVVVSGQNTDHHHHSRVQSQQSEFPVEVEDGPGHERTIDLLTYQPNQFSGDLPQQSQAREEGQRFTNDSSITHRGGGGGGGGDRQQSGLNRQHTGGGGGRRRHSGRGLRQGGGGRQRGGGRRLQQQGSGDGNNINSDNNRDTASSLDTDISQSHSNAMILLLQRLGDRLTGIEVLQRQQTERISTINYRLTKLELQAEERKSVTSDLGNAVRHRMETTDAELDQVNEQLQSIKTSIMGLGHQYSDLKVSIAEIPKESDQRGNEVNGLKMQSMLGAVQEIRTSTDQIKDNTEQLTKNLTALNMIAQNLTNLAEKMVTKQYLYENLNELRSQDSAVSLLAKMVMVPPPAPSRRASLRKVPEDCWQLMKQGNKKSGVYSIQPRYSPQPFFVYCDMETDGGGWTVIQRREDGSVDFLREWMDYKHGFGNVAGEYWLGNEKIHLLTNQQVSVLRVDVADFDQQAGHALYSAFAIGPEQEGYSLKILGKYSGDAGDSLRYHVGRRFSTLDVDNDAWPDRSCARDHMGAWWYRACETSNLNGRYLHGPVPVEHQYTGLYWYDFRGPQYSLWKSTMMVRRGGKVDRPVFRDFADVHNQTARVPDMQEVAVVTTTSPDDFDPNQDPYVTFEYPNF